MRAWIVIAVLAAAACGDKQSPPKNEFEAFERKYVAQYEALAKGMRKQGKEVADKDIPTDYRAVYIGPPGVFIDRTLVATLAELPSKHAVLVAAIAANAKLVPTIGYSGPVVTFDLGPQPASTAIAALRLFADRTTGFYIQREDPEVPLMVVHTLCGELRLHDTPSEERDAPKLSVFLDKGHTWVGVSRVNEFQELVDKPGGLDLEKLKDTLRDHKSGAFFADRSDLELAASAGSSGDVLAALQTACNEGFIDISVLAPEQLSARPQL